MSKQCHLKIEERKFFSLVNEAVLANPFSDERTEIDRKISGLFPENSREEVTNEAIQEVDRRIALLDQSGRGNISFFSGQDREMLMTAYLFVIFHRFLDACDALIEEQLKAEKTSLKVPFAQEMIDYLLCHGFDHSSIMHYIALCYQLRRAFYFITRRLVGQSACMKKLRESLWNNIFTYDLDLYNRYLWPRMEDFSTLIFGETGTGKGTAARAIGMSGFIPFDEKKGCFKESFTKIFLPLNISQFSENLIESELFGHKKGAFTGAVEDHQGVFNQCSPHGAIFLDEIGEVGASVQIKLLKILEERVFSPVGSHEAHRFEGRIIAATNRDISDIETNCTTSFRSDFFYRLCSDIIIVPSLRERITEDQHELDELIANTIEKIVGEPSSKLTDMVLDTILKQPGRNYSWPGNVRELSQCVRRILLKRNYSGHNTGKAVKMASTSDMDGSRSEIISNNIGLTINNDKELPSATEILQIYCKFLYDRHGTLGEVSRITRLDRRTVKKYIYSS